MNRPIIHPVTPSQRRPRPTLAGNVRNTGTGTGAKQTFPLRTPRTGTAWELESFNLTLLGPAPTITEDLNVQLLLSGRIIDVFELDSGIIVAGGTGLYPITIAHNYASPFLIYDTDTFELRQEFSETPAAGVFEYRYYGSVRYA